ncbi:MAG TPA: response regulator [Verrucomicrobiae bacterium]
MSAAIENNVRSILVVDDDPTLRRSYAIALARAGHQVQEAPSGEAAVRLCEQQKFSLLITDMIMPDMDGLETIRRVRVIQPEIKIIAMSGGGRMEAINYLMLAVKLGAHRAMQKPFGVSEMQNMVANVFTEPNF